MSYTNQREMVEDGSMTGFHSNAMGISRGAAPWADRVKPDIPERDPVAQWEKHKGAWHGDAAGWERYSGYKLPETHPDSPRYQGE